MNRLKIEIQNVLAMAAALEREPVKPGKNEVSDRMERRYQIQARFDALLVEACAPGYSGERVNNGPTMWGRAGE